MNQKAAAKALGVSAKTLQTWQEEPWFPAKGRTKDGYDVAAIDRARKLNGRKGSDPQRSSRSDQLGQLKVAREAQRLKREQIACERDSLALRRECHEVIDRRSLELFASTFLTDFGDWCDQLPDVIAVKSGVPAKHRKAVSRTLKEALDGRRQQMKETLEARAREMDAERREAATADE